MCGAPSATQLATAETQEIAEEMKSQLEEKENQKFSVFKAISFRRQVVAGINFFIKVGTEVTWEGLRTWSQSIAESSATSSFRHTQVLRG